MKRYLNDRVWYLKSLDLEKFKNVNTQGLVDIIRSRVTLNPICSMRDRARYLGVSDWTIWNVIQKQAEGLVVGQDSKIPTHRPPEDVQT